MRSSWTALIEVALGIGQSLEPNIVFRRILDGLSLLIPYDVGTVLLLEGDWLKVAAHRGLRRNLSELELRFEVSANPRLRRAVQLGHPVRFLDPFEPDPFDDLVEGAEVLIGKMHSCMAAPLLIGQELIGLITIDSLTPDCFSKEHEPLISFFGSFAALAIHNARLVTSLKDSRQQLENQNQSLRQSLRSSIGQDIIGNSPLMVHLRQAIAVAATSDAPVLILGPTGCGKELVARAIHAASARKEAQLVYVNCAAIPESLAESELFGHTKGAFTGSMAERKGKFEQADGGTLFLDEVGELPLAIQATLLRVLQEGEIQRVGSDLTKRVKVRVLAATNCDLEQMILKGSFRRDLYHRISVLNISVPALAQRKEDIPVLLEYFLNKLKEQLGVDFQIHPQLLDEFMQKDWSGGVRELFHALEAKAIWAKALGHKVISSANSLPEAISRSQPQSQNSLEQWIPLGFKGATEQFQRELIQTAVTIHGGNHSAAARELGMDPANFHRKLHSLQDSKK